MKNIINILILLALATLFSCGGSQEAEMPTDLKGWRAELINKQAELRDLKKEISDIESKVEALDVNRKVNKKLITTIKPTKEDFKTFLEVQGTVQSEDAVRLGSETGGRIIRLNVDAGDQVRKGQLIAKLDLESLDKQKQELQKALELASTVFERQSRLWDQKIGSEIQYLEAKNNKERIEKSLETITFQMGKSNVYAPMAGIIDQVMITEGEMATPGYPIVLLINTRKVKVVADLPENYLRAVRKGENVTVNFPAIDVERKARVSLVGSSINPANRTFQVEVQLSNNDALLKPNLLANMIINDFTKKDAITLPIELIQQEIGGKDFIYVMGEKDGNYIAEKRYVDIGESFEGKIVINDGLKGDETIIHDGARGLTAGEMVEYSDSNETNNEG